MGVEIVIFKEAKGVTNWNDLLEIIELNQVKAGELREAIRKLKVDFAKVDNVKKAVRRLEIKKTTPADSSAQDSLFEDEISFYLDDYKKLGHDFSREDLIEILPSRKNYDYKRIVLRLMSESVKEMKELHEFIAEGSDLEESELLELRSMLLHEEKKLSSLREILSMKDEESLEQSVDNQLILVPNRGGTIRVIDEIEHLPKEYYQAFLELIQSIVDGTFKGVKRFTNNNAVKGLCEVKGNDGERVLFMRLNHDSYAIISAFVKKTDKDRGYFDALKRKVADYREVEESLRIGLEDEEFLHDNELYVQELFRLLNPRESVKKNVKGGCGSDE